MHSDLKFGKETKRRNYDWVPYVIRWSIYIVIVCFIAFVFVWYLGHKVSCVGDSMKPVIQHGDVVLVNRFQYDVRMPKRGEIIVFKPKGNQQYHSSIKRVIGIPGDEVLIKGGNIYVNGEKSEAEYLTQPIQNPGLAAEPIKLDENEFFVLGDFSAGSEDSRMATVGNIKRSEIIGRAWLIVSPGKHFGKVE